MSTRERMRSVEEYIAKHSYASINELSQHFDLSKSTIRRYLIRLHEEHAVELVPGGAIHPGNGDHSSIFEQPYDIKRQTNLEEKQRIAKAAAQLLPPRSNAFLYSSSTVYEMLEHLQDKQDLIVTTNDVMIASALSGVPGLSVLMVGGTVRPNYYTTMGYFAESMLKEMVFDVTFLGIDGISLNAGITITNVEEASCKRTVIASSKKVIALCDHTKFEKATFIKVCDLDRIDMIITGRELSADMASAFTETGVNIVQV